MKYLYYNRDEVDCFEKCLAGPSGTYPPLSSLGIELAFDSDTDFMMEFIKSFREKTNRTLRIEAVFGTKDSGPEGENSFITIKFHTESDWKLAFDTIESIINDYSEEIVVEDY